LTPHSYGVETLQVKRFKKTESESVLDNIVQEHPIALVYNGISHAVMMATPTDVSVFAKGFSLSEGILTSLKELYAIEVHESELGIEVNMTISSRAFAALKERRRMLVGRTGCGLCGIESLEQLQLDIPKITIEPSKEWLEQIPIAISQLKDQQKITALTGGAHAAAWVTRSLGNRPHRGNRYWHLDHRMPFVVLNDEAVDIALMNERLDFIHQLHPGDFDLFKLDANLFHGTQSYADRPAKVQFPPL